MRIRISELCFLKEGIGVLSDVGTNEQSLLLALLNRCLITYTFYHFVPFPKLCFLLVDRVSQLSRSGREFTL